MVHRIPKKSAEITNRIARWRDKSRHDKTCHREQTDVPPLRYRDAFTPSVIYHHDPANSQKAYTHTELCLLIGSDNWKIFDRWKSHDEIIENYPIYIYPRPGFPVETTILPPTVHLTHAPMMEISSTEIRDLIATGQSTEKYLPLPVHDYIVKHNLYQNPK